MIALAGLLAVFTVTAVAVAAYITQNRPTPPPPTPRPVINYTGPRHVTIRVYTGHPPPTAAHRPPPTIEAGTRGLLPRTTQR